MSGFSTPPQSPDDEDTHKGEDLEGALVDLAATIGDDADDDLLPTVGTPGLGLGAAAEVRDVLQDAA